MGMGPFFVRVVRVVPGLNQFVSPIGRWPVALPPACNSTSTLPMEIYQVEVHVLRFAKRQMEIFLKIIFCMLPTRAY